VTIIGSSVQQRPVAETFFGLSLLPCDEVAESFVTCLMMPGAVSLPITLLTYFVAADSDFLPTLWAHATDVMPVTTNGAESYHGHLNAEFNAPHHA